MFKGVIQVHSFVRFIVASRRCLLLLQMEKRLKQLQQEHPNQLKLEVAGKSVEGRNLYLVILTEDVLRSEASGGPLEKRGDNATPDFREGNQDQQGERTASIEPTNRIPYPPKPIVFPMRSKSSF